MATSGATSAITRLCIRCGIRPAYQARGRPPGKVCATCFLKLMETLFAEPYPCPACGREVAVTDAPMRCECGWSEDDADAD